MAILAEFGYLADFWRTVHISGQICNFRSEHARDLILVSNPMFLGMGNHLGPYSGASDQSEGQEQGGGAVGGQGRLQGVKL